MILLSQTLTPFESFGSQSEKVQSFDFKSDRLLTFWFTMWHVVITLNRTLTRCKDLIRNLTSCKFLIPDLTSCVNFDLKFDTLWIFLFKIRDVVEHLIRNLTCCKKFDSKFGTLWHFDSKSDPCLNFWFRIWRVESFAKTDTLKDFTSKTRQVVVNSIWIFTHFNTLIKSLMSLRNLSAEFWHFSKFLAQNLPSCKTSICNLIGY